MTAQGTIRILSAADVAALALSPDAAREAVLAIFAAHNAGRALAKPKLAIELAPGHAFQTMIAASPELGLAANKWLGMTPPAAGAAGVIDALIALSDLASGRLLALVDGASITAIRTAAMSAAAASRLARRDSRTIGFVGCGLQARTHLAAMAALIPSLDTVLAFDGTRRTTHEFAAHAGTQGFAARIVDDAEALVRASDLLVTSVPMRPGLTPFLDPAWIAPGAFVAAIDVARSFAPVGLRGLDLVATDEREQAAQQPVSLHFASRDAFDADLSQLAAGAKVGRTRADERAMFVFRGFSLGDLAVAALAYRSAQAQGTGTVLPWGPG